MNKKVCYWCESLATSREHVPPKCIFPELGDTGNGVNHREQLITVPACDLHNIAKSNDDEYLLYVLAMNILNNDVGQTQAKTKVMRALQRAKSRVDMLFGESRSILVEDISTGNLEKTFAFKVDGAKLNNVLEHIARAIYFHHFGNRWNGLINIFPEFLVAMNLPDASKRNERFEILRSSANEIFSSTERHGANQEVFFYQLIEGPSQFLLRLSFYGATRVMVAFGEI